MVKYFVNLIVLKYLGHFLCNDLSDVTDILRQSRCLSIQENILELVNVNFTCLKCQSLCLNMRALACCAMCNICIIDSHGITVKLTMTASPGCHPMKIEITGILSIVSNVDLSHLLDFLCLQLWCSTDAALSSGTVVAVL